MIARLLLPLIVVFWCQPLAAAQENRSSGRQGVVVDESGGAIAGARLVVPSLRSSALVLRHTGEPQRRTTRAISAPRIVNAYSRVCPKWVGSHREIRRSSGRI